MNWLAILISSLRDFTRREASLHSGNATLHDATASLHAAKQPYTTHSVFTRGAAACRPHLNNKNNKKCFFVLYCLRFALPLHPEMRRKTAILLLWAALAMMLGSCRHGLQQTLTDVTSELGNIIGSDEAEAKEVPAGEVKPTPDPSLKGGEKGDSLSQPSQPTSQSEANSQPSSQGEELLVDTTKMDSLQLAVYRHNKAIDDSISLDSINRQRKNGIDSPVEYVANDSIIYLLKKQIYIIHSQYKKSQQL